MPVDVCTQYLPWMHAVLDAPRPPSIAKLYSRLRTPAGYALSFFVSFRGWLWTERESKYTFIIKQDSVMQHKHHTNISGRKIVH